MVPLMTVMWVGQDNNITYFAKWDQLLSNIDNFGKVVNSLLLFDCMFHLRLRWDVSHLTAVDSVLMAVLCVSYLVRSTDNKTF